MYMDLQSSIHGEYIQCVKQTWNIHRTTSNLHATQINTIWQVQVSLSSWVDSALQYQNHNALGERLCTMLIAEEMPIVRDLIKPIKMLYAYWKGSRWLHSKVLSISEGFWMHRRICCWLRLSIIGRGQRSMVALWNVGNVSEAVWAWWRLCPCDWVPFLHLELPSKWRKWCHRRLPVCMKVCAPSLDVKFKALCRGGVGSPC